MRQIIRALVVFAVMTATWTVVFAQPGDEPQRIHAKVNSILDGIAYAEKEMALYKNAWAYGNLGGRYVELYKALNRDPYSRFYGERPPELANTVILAKAAELFTEGMKLENGAGFYQARCEVYANRWYDTAIAINWYDDMRKMGDPEWADLFQDRTPEREMAELGKFLKLDDFGRAVSDCEKSLEMPHYAESAAEAHRLLARVYLERAERIMSGLERSYISAVNGRNPFNYDVFADIDTAIAHTIVSSPDNRYRQMSAVEYSWFVVPQITPRYALYYKAELAMAFGKYDIALKALNNAATYVDQREAADNFICQYFPLRSKLNSLNGNFDAALADAMVKPQRSDGEACYNTEEPFGDAYFGKGDVPRAIEHYTMALSASNGTYDVPPIQAKLARAYLKAGEPDKALKVLGAIDSYFITPEMLLLRANVERTLGRADEAKKDESAARKMRENKEHNVNWRGIYGKVLMPDGTPITDHGGFAWLVYEHGETERWSNSIDAKGRFRFTHMSQKPFHIYAAFDTIKDGKPVRYFARSETMTLHNDKLNGPVVIKLDKVELRA